MNLKVEIYEKGIKKYAFVCYQTPNFFNFCYYKPKPKNTLYVGTVTRLDTTSYIYLMGRMSIPKHLEFYTSHIPCIDDFKYWLSHWSKTCPDLAEPVDEKLDMYIRNKYFKEEDLNEMRNEIKKRGYTFVETLIY